MKLQDLKDYLPLLIPIVIVQFTLLGYTIHHILTHENYKKGSRGMWLIISLVGMNFLGPILYFALGKEDE